MINMQSKLKEFNIARKLKGALTTFVALQRMQNELGATASALEAQERLLLVQKDPERLEELRESFDMLDRDHMDRISLENLAEFLRMFGSYKNDDEVKKMIERYDVYNHGHITFDEFCIMMGPTMSESNPQEMQATFNALDVNHVGQLTRAELREVLVKIGGVTSDSELEAMLALADKKGTGSIDFQTFSEFMSTPVSDWTSSEQSGELPWNSDVY